MNDTGKTRSPEPRKSSMKDSNIKKTETINQKVLQVHEFDDILAIIGSQGICQKKLLYRFILPFSIFVPIFFWSQFFMLAEPDHWCSVPGRQETNLTAEEWKNLTISPEIGSDGISRFSKCSMYGEYPDPEVFYPPNASRFIIRCTNGWEFDRSEYRATIPTELEWVCDRAHYSSQALMVNFAGNAVGALVLGWAADRIGRRLTFMLSTAVTLIFRAISLHVTDHFSWFLLTQFLTGIGFPVMYITALVIVTEISGKEFRSWIFAYYWTAWILGNFLLTIIVWILGEWYSIGIITALPAIAVLFFGWKLLHESPRWLLSVGRLKDAEILLQEIAETNETFANLQGGQLKRMLAELKAKMEQEKIEAPFPVPIQGIWNLLSRARIAKYTGLLCLVWFTCLFVHHGITLNSKLASNQFLNLIMLFFIELPVGIVGRFFSEIVGRRWSQVAFCGLCTIGLIATTLTVYVESYLAILITVLVSRFAISITCFLVILRATEIFPTELRATGIGFVSTGGAIGLILATYCSYLGHSHAAIPYFYLAIISTIGLISSSMLPETLRQCLPETVTDSNAIGKSTEFWTFLPKDYKGTRRRNPTASDYASTPL